MLSLRVRSRVVVADRLLVARRDGNGAMGRSPALLGAAARTVGQALATNRTDMHRQTGRGADHGRPKRRTEN